MKFEQSPKGLWYFAHPYTEKDKDGAYVPEAEEANYRLCCARSGELILRGYNVYSPIAHTHPIHRACPVLLQRREHNLWYVLDNEFIMRTRWNGLILAPGWTRSSGCTEEYRLFRERGESVLEYKMCMREPVKLERVEHDDAGSGSSR